MIRIPAPGAPQIGMPQLGARIADQPTSSVKPDMRYGEISVVDARLPQPALTPTHPPLPPTKPPPIIDVDRSRSMTLATFCSMYPKDPRCAPPYQATPGFPSRENPGPDVDPDLPESGSDAAPDVDPGAPRVDPDLPFPGGGGGNGGYGPNYDYGAPDYGADNGGGALVPTGARAWLDQQPRWLRWAMLGGALAIVLTVSTIALKRRKRAAG